MIDRTGIDRTVRRLVGVAAALAVASAAGAQDVIRLHEQSGSTVRLDGTTTIRASWRCTSDRPDAAMELDGRRAGAAEAVVGGAAPTETAVHAVQRISLRVQASDLDCGNPMASRALRKALRAQDVIGEFRLVPGSASSARSVRVQGQLTVAGVTRDVTMDVATTWDADGSVRASGELPLRLSDFNIEPPRVLFSAVRASDRLKVTFDLRLGVPPAERAGMIAHRSAANGSR